MSCCSGLKSVRTMVRPLKPAEKDETECSYVHVGVGIQRETYEQLLEALSKVGAPNEVLEDLLADACKQFIARTETKR